MTQLEVSKVLFEGNQSSKNILIFQCKVDKDGERERVCLKLVDNNAIYQGEKEAYMNMVAKNGPCSLFLQVYFFIEVIMPDKRVWKGFCMKEGMYSLREILFTPTTTTDCLMEDVEHRKILKTILQDKERALQQKSMCNGDTVTGEAVVFQQDQSIQLSLAIAALRLLHRMHTVYGWIHGDSHLGNFMYSNGRLYAIDFERSFASTLPDQHLLDLQECFGHFSGVLLNPIRANDWDMRDIFGLYYYRHPLGARGGKCSKHHLHSRRKTLYMLPVCMCFTCPTEELRLQGCAFCRSASNQQSARFMANHFEDVIQDLSNWGLVKMKNGLALTRSITITKQCCMVTDLIYPCIQDGSVLTQKMIAMTEEERPKKRKLYVEVDESTSALTAKLVAELTKSKQSCMTTMKRLLYMPMISLKAKNIVKEIVARIRYAGFAKQANTLGANVASALAEN